MAWRHRARAHERTAQRSNNCMTWLTQQNTFALTPQRTEIVFVITPNVFGCESEAKQIDLETIENKTFEFT